MLFVAAAAVAADLPGKTEWLETDTGKLKARAFASPTVSAHPALVIVLHGDAPRTKPGYQYTFAMRAASQGDIVAAAILRPGYTDPSGETSDGVRGLTTGDNYTADRIAMIVTAIHDLQTEYQPRATVLVGHSGGAAISADILALQPPLAQAALLVSCPCDLAPWREHMKEIAPTPAWDEPVESLSPLALADRVPSTVRLRMMVGAQDNVAPPELTRRYADRLKARGVDVAVTELAGKDHEILLDPAVEQGLAELVAGLGAASQ
jgi:predicted esterase